MWQQETITMVFHTDGQEETHQEIENTCATQPDTYVHGFDTNGSLLVQVPHDIARAVKNDIAALTGVSFSKFIHQAAQDYEDTRAQQEKPAA